MGIDKFGVFISIPLQYNPESDKKLISDIIEEYKMESNVKVEDVISAIRLLQHPDLKIEQQPILQGPVYVNQIVNELAHQRSWDLRPAFSPFVRDLQSFIINVNNGFWASYNGYPHFIDRDIMLFGEPVDWTLVKGVKYFSGAEYGCFLSLQGSEFPFLNTELRQNDSPTVGDFISFMIDNEDFTAHGYARAPGKSHEVVITGLEYIYKEGEEIRRDLIEALEKWCYITRDVYWKPPQSFIENNEKIRCWWD